MSPDGSLDPRLAAAGSGRATVLLVDDEAEILTALTDLLEERFEVVSTTRPEEALAMLAGGLQPAVILSDQRMPGLTGDVFLERARAHTDAEALLLTGYAELDAVVGAVNRGRIAGYAAKPWEPEGLLAMVGAAGNRYALRQALATERALMQGLLENLPDELSFKDAEGRFLRLNAAKAAALGREAEACLGRREAEFLDGEAAARLARAEAAAASGAMTELEERPGGPAVGARWVQVSRVPLGNGVLVTIGRDVTEARQLETRLRQADKMQALGTMAGGVAHDFNNLLTAILGSLQLAERRLVGEQPALQRLLRNAGMAAERGSALTRRLLAFSRQNELALRAVSVNGLILGMDDLLARSLGGPTDGLVTIRRELGAAPDTAVVDPGQLELALLNLCINARDAMPSGGTITLSTEAVRVAADSVPELPAGDYVRVTIADSGVGMTPEVLARVCEPFFTTKEVGKGTGLGLPMVYGLVQQCGGGMTIESAPGAGTTVSLYLPRGGAEAPRSPRQSGEPPVARRGVRVLVVDDDPTVREVTAGFLTDLGHETVEAADGPSALRALEGDPGVRLVVADFAMPHMTGAELSERVRAMRPGLPVLIVTGYAELTAIPPETHVLHKPYQPAELAKRVAALLG